MKQYLLILLVFLGACSSKQGEIKERYLSQQYVISPKTATTDGVNYHLIIRDPNLHYYIDSLGAVMIYDSIYKLEPTWGQAIQAGKHDGSGIIFVIGVIIFLFGIYWYIKKSQEGTRSPQDRSVLAWLIIPFLGFAIAGGAFSWDKWNDEREVPKAKYDSYQGNFDQLWKEPAKIY